MPGVRRQFTWQHEDRTSADDEAEALQGLVMLTLVIPLITVGARRLHDTNKSAWWQLFALSPPESWLVISIFFLMPGEPDSKRFGQPEVL